MITFGEQIIQKVIDIMNPSLNPEQNQMLENCLVSILYNCEIQPRTTELMTIDNTPVAKLKQFIATKRVEGKSEKTLEAYYRCLYKLLETVNKDLDEYTTLDLRYYLACYKKNRTVSNVTINNMRRIFSSFFSWLSDEEIITRNPAKRLKEVKTIEKVDRSFSEQQLESLRYNCSNIRDRALIEFLNATGCRVSEVVGLNIEDIHFDSNEAIVLGKGSKERQVYFTDTAKMYLQKYLETRVSDKGPLFTSRKNQFQRIHDKGIQAIIRKLGAQSNVTKATPHRFRHTLTTRLINRGANMQDVQTILGHKNISTTQIYFKNNCRSVKFSYIKYA